MVHILDVHQIQNDEHIHQLAQAHGGQLVQDAVELR